MPFLPSIDSIRSIEWAKTFNWDIKFEPSPPAPFKNWFPATAEEENMGGVESYAFEGPIETFHLPNRLTDRNIRLTFFDDVTGTLEKWFKEWILLEIFGNHLYVLPLNSAVRLIHLMKLDNMREAYYMGSFWVYPEGALIDTRDSESGIIKFDLGFKIVGVAGEGYREKSKK